MTTDHRQILVLGGTGKTGTRVADRLRSRGESVRVVSRSTSPAFDWEDQSTWAAVFQGADAAYISYYPDLAAPGAPEAIAALAGQAVAAGTRRLVLLSGRGEEEAERAEVALQESGADWTVVRCAWFDQNFSESYFRDPLMEGELALPSDAAALEPWVDVDDIADVAVAALTEDGHSGELYELTGPRLITLAEAVEVIGRATGREMRYQQIPMADFEAGLAAEGLPDDIVALLRYLFTKVLGHNATLADGVQRALGREPRDFADFARDAAAGGTWAAADQVAR